MSILSNYTPLAYFFSFSSNAQDAKQNALRKVVEQLEKSSGQDFDFFYDIGLTKYETQKEDDQFKMNGELVIFRSIQFELFKGSKLILFPPKVNQPEGLSYVPFQFSSPLTSIFGEASNDANNNILLPDFKLLLQQPSLRLQFSNDLFYPAQRIPKAPKPGQSVAYKIADKKGAVNLDLSIGSFGYSTKESFVFEEAAYLALPDPIAIGKSGCFLDQLKIGFKNGDQGWQFEVPSAELILPKAIQIAPNTLKLKDASISEKGGFSGTVSSIWKDGFSAKVFGFSLKLSSLLVGFKNNQLEKVSINGELGLPFFDDPDEPQNPIAVKLAIDHLGGVSVMAQASQKNKQKNKDTFIASLALDGFHLDLTSMHISAPSDQQSEGTIVLGGQIRIDDQDPKKALRIPLEGLKITSKGQVSFPGGWFDLKDKLMFNHHGLKVGISRIGFGFGQEAQQESFIGFDGNLQLPASLPAQVKVKGFQYYWNELGENGFRLRGIDIDFTIPEAVKFKGALEFFDEANPPSASGLRAIENISGLSGKIGLQVIPLKFGINAQLVIASQRQESGAIRRFWMIYVDASLPTGIPIGPNVAFYGLQGLLAERLLPNKKKEEHWYRDWYKKPPIGAYDISKWQVQEESFAFGLGVHLGTFVDGGYLFNANALFTMGFPGPIVLFSGKANFLRSRKDTLDPSKEGIFNFLLLYDGREEEFLFNIELNYEQQKLLKVSGLMEIYFHLRDPGKWHFYLGEKPKPKRITAQLIEFLQANAYLMVDAKGMQFGFFVGIDKKWDFGPIGVRLACYIKGDVAIIWAPEFFAAAFELKGEVALRIFWFELGLMLLARAELQTPRPFLFDLLATVKLTLPFPLPSPAITVHLRWENPEAPAFKMPFIELQIDQNEALENSQTWKAQSSPNFTEDSELVPMDAVLNFIFDKRVGIGKSSKEALGLAEAPAFQQKLGQNGENWYFDYQLENLSIARKVIKTEGGEPVWQDITQEFKGKAALSILDNTSAEPKSTERYVLQIGSTNPLRYWRHTDTNNLPPSRLKVIGENLCPVPFDDTEICWVPNLPDGALWIIDAIEEKDFSISSSTGFYQGRKACIENTGEMETDLSSDASCLLSIRGGKTRIRFKTEVGKLSLRLRAARGIRLSVEENEGNIQEIQPTQIWGDRFSFELNASNGFGRNQANTILIEGECWCIESLCYLPINDWQHKAWSESTRSFWSRAITKWEHSKASLLEADTEYRIHFKLKGRRWHEKASDKKEEQIEEKILYFKTKAQIFELDDYLEGRVPTQGKHLHFRNDRIDLHFKAGCDYVLEMLNKIGAQQGDASNLEVHLYSDDPKPQVVLIRSKPGQYTKWTRIQEKIRTAQKCHEGAFKKVEKSSKSKHWIIGQADEALNLKPQQHYRAQVVQTGVTDGLYRFEFRTSAYFNLEELVRKYSRSLVHDLAIQKNYLTGQLLDRSLTEAQMKTLDQLLSNEQLQKVIGHDLFKSLDRQTEHQQFERLAALFSVPRKTSSRGTTCYHIQDAKHHYGVFIQFEEPINWDRTRLSAQLTRSKKAEGVVISDNPQSNFYVLRSADGTQWFMIKKGPFSSHQNARNAGLSIDAGPAATDIFLLPSDHIIDGGIFTPVVDSTIMIYELQLRFQYTRDFIYELGLDGQSEQIAAFYKKHAGMYPIHSLDEGRKGEDFIVKFSTTTQK